MSGALEVGGNAVGVLADSLMKAAVATQDRQSVRAGTLVLVAPQVDEQTLWVLHNAYRRGSNVVVLACARNDTLRTMQARGQRLGVQVHSTLWESDLSTLAPVQAAQAARVT